jgi:hypothetical protein
MRRDDRDVQCERVLDIRRELFVFSISEKDIPVDFVELDAEEQAIEVDGAYDESHACRDCSVLDGGEGHRSPGHHVLVRSSRGDLRLPRRHQMAEY